MPGRTPGLAELAEAVRAVESRGSATADLPPLSPSAHEAAKAGLRLLRSRARSRHELRERLLAKEFEPGPVEEAVDRLADWGLLDDADFAREWVRQRSERRGKTRVALRRELADKGVAPQVAEVALEEVDPQVERARAEELVRARLERRTPAGQAGPPADRPDWPAERRRLAAFLQRRGYSAAVAVRVVDEVAGTLDR